VSSTSVHIPAGLLRQLDRAAKQRRISRNRLIVEACRSHLGEGQSDWPDDFFAADRLAHRDRALLRSTFDDWMDELRQSRRSKQMPPF
jgi:hypothetical protein